MSSVSDPQSVTAYVKDGANIAAILLTWGAFAAVFRYGIGDLSLPFGRIWVQMANLFVVTGLLNAVLYLLYRTVDYWHDSA